MYKKNKGYILKIRDSKTFKGFTAFVLLNFIFEMIQPSLSLALTEGPSQPEVQSFEPIGTNQMVDLFTGDFNYNIPLFNLPGPNGGYPVNLAYHAGVSMDDEASWVGLGWNINAGSLVRNMRGLPDEFLSVESEEDSRSADPSHDYLEVKSDMKQSWTLGVRGSLSTEIFGNNLNDASLSASIYYNNYNGLGLSVGGGMDMGANSNYSLGLSLDSENGLGVSASLNLRKGKEDNIKEHKFGFTFDGSLSVDYSFSKMSEAEAGVRRKSGKTVEGMISTGSSTYGSSLSFARSSFSPAIAHRVNNYNLSFSLGSGVSGFGIFGKGSLGLFYNTQDFSDDDKKGRKNLIVGYDQLGDLSVDDHYSKDFIRLNDGQITKANMFLPVSSYTYDVYNSSGQGLSGYFRPRRTDIGAMHDPYIFNSSFGVNASVQLGLTTGTSVGVDAGLNWGSNYQKRWRDANDLTLDFQNPNGLGINEILYYQAHGETTVFDINEMSHINGFNLPNIVFEDSDEDDEPIGRRKVKNNTSLNLNRISSNRVVRNTLIHKLKNEEVSKLGEFNIKYYQNNNFNVLPNAILNRETRDVVNIEKHPAGFKILNGEGNYYVYALPAYNLKEVENLFSVAYSNANSKTIQYSTIGSEVDYEIAGTNKFINKTTKSPYAHSHLLTSVQGADYVDVSNDGPSDNDLGYWVKFDYFKKADDYKWRSPYVYKNAFYNRGAVFTQEDDKASYSFGKKELWYLARIETKSHIAIFRLSEREDMTSAEGEHEFEGITRSMKLDKIQIFEKKSFLADPENAIPLQEIHFSYEYKLCANTYSSRVSNRKKLTLTKLWMTYNGSNRGSLNKYEFDYGNEPLDNPDFVEGAYDSWGNYKPIGSKVEHSSQFPYVNQFNQEWVDGWQPNYSGASPEDQKRITKETQNKLVSAWCLKKIKLPSGGEINIEYESDDYGYVQHKQAAQMFKIKKLGDHNLLGDDEIYDGEIGANNDFHDPNGHSDEERRRIYFKLEEPLITGLNDLQKAEIIYNKYVKPLIQDENNQRNLYIKTKMGLTNNVFDYVSGYFPLENNLTTDGSPNHYNYGSEDLEYGFVTIQAAKRKKAGEYFDNYHPLALAGWTYLQTNAQKLLNNPNSLAEEGTFTNAGALLRKLTDLLNVLPSTAASFGAIRAYCRSKNMCRFIDLDYSCIRLASPDKIKYGGGHRVKQISITDNWNSDTQEQDRTYGQVYEYTMEENDEIISSGVAQYEPQAGGDENPLKYPHYYFDKQNYFTNNNLFTEAPINENLFPGASVGYRKVTVKSLNTTNQIRSATPKGRTGGVTVHEFFTSKDFPTIVENTVLSEELKTKHVFNLPIIIPLIGSIKRNNYHGIQSYKIELNDMHGKPKSVKSFELNNYVQNINPITETIYEYQTKPLIYQNENCLRLDNYVSIIENNGNHAVNPQKRVMGVEYDFFTDQRENFNKQNDFSLAIGLDIPTIPAPITIASIWPNFNNHKTLFRSYVTNKVIHRSGILKKTITRDLQTSNETEVIAYDEKSGVPLLTKMKNDFGDDFYSYNVPAYYHYDRMGHAYENINYTFVEVLYPQSHSHGNEFAYISGSSHLNYLFRGDELLVYNTKNSEDEDLINPNVDEYKKAYFIGWITEGNETRALLHFPSGINCSNSPNLTFKVIRSGKRNHYSSIAANYVTKGLQLNNLTNHTLINDPAYSTITTKKFPVNSVLSASATVYNDNWSSNYTTDLVLSYDPSSTEGSGSSDYNLGGGINRVKNPFLMGISGIWRTEKSYSYVGPRKTTASMSDNTTSDPALFDDGVFEDAIPMFSWDLGYMEEYVSKWEWVNEVTRYSFDSYETENVNRLGIYSSALYGYDNSLSIAVGGNSNYFELGFDDFETAVEVTGVWDNLLRLGQNNLNFYKSQNQNKKQVTSEQVDIEQAIYSYAGQGYFTMTLRNPSPYIEDFLINPSYQYQDNGNDYLNSTFGVCLKSVKKDVPSVTGNMGYYLNGVIKNVKMREVNGQITYEIKFKPYFHCAHELESELKEGARFYGKLTCYEKRKTLSQNLNNVNVTSAKAHTGKKSMTINGTALFDQPKIKAKKGKPYIWSMWVSRDNTDVSNFVTNSNFIETGYINSNNEFIPFTNSIIKKGKIVEGWQKIDIEMKIDPLLYPSLSEYPILGLRFNSGSSKIYVDDVRFSPKTGGVTTYVYDPLKFWLRANLNVDNYATYFYYDEQGNLSIKKQETEKGIFTITESRGHVSED
jgi:hypothetical protein